MGKVVLPCKVWCVRESERPGSRISCWNEYVDNADDADTDDNDDDYDEDYDDSIAMIILFQGNVVVVVNPLALSLAPGPDSLEEGPTSGRRTARPLPRLRHAAAAANDPAGEQQ